MQAALDTLQEAMRRDVRPAASIVTYAFAPAVLDFSVESRDMRMSVLPVVQTTIHDKPGRSYVQPSLLFPKVEH